MSNAVRLKLVEPPPDPAQAIRMRLRAELAIYYAAYGFTELHQVVTQELELLSKRNRVALTAEGWIA